MGFSYDSFGTRLATPSRFWRLTFDPGLGSIDGGRTKPSGTFLRKKTSCYRVLGSSAPNFLTVPYLLPWHFEPLDPQWAELGINGLKSLGRDW